MGRRSLSLKGEIPERMPLDDSRPRGRLLADFRFAARLLRRDPGFTALSVLVLGVGIGAATAVYSVVDHVLLRPLPIPDAERVVTLCETHESLRGWCGVSTPNLLDWGESTAAFSSLGAARARSFLMRDEDRGIGVYGGIATAGFLTSLGFPPLHGRLLEEADLPPEGSGRVLVVSHAFWQNELGADPDVVGRTVVLDEQPYAVVGVLPEEARAPRLDGVRVWAPLPWSPSEPENRDWRGFIGIGRLAGDVRREEAQDEVRAVQARLAEVHPEAVRGYGVEVRGLRDEVVGDTRPLLLVFLGSVVLVLLIVCVNMAALLLTRATAREREMGVRTALGAGRWALARQLIVESVLLGVLGGAFGIVLSFWATEAFLSLAPAGIPRIDEVSVDGRILSVALAVSVLSGLLFGAIPALRVRDVDASDALREGRSGGTGSSRSRLRRTLVAAQVALAVVLSVGAGLLLRSFTELLDWRPGFETEGLVAFSTLLSMGKYPENDHALAFYRQAEEAIAALPGVRSVATVSAGPLFGGGDGATPILREGSDESADAAPSVLWFDAGPGYFSTLEVPLLDGRAFRESDEDLGESVAVINEAMAGAYWPGRSPVGSRIRLPELGGEVAEVIGVVGNVQPFHAGRAPEPALWLSNRQHTRWGTFFVVRTDGDPAPLIEPIREAVQRIDPDLDPRLRSMDDLVRAQLVAPRFNTLVMTLFAGVALVLALVGVYGVVSYAVELQTHEIGVRMALGAERGQVLRWILAEGGTIVVGGLVLGLLAALVATRLLASLLYGVSPLDPFAFAGTFVFVLLAAIAAVVVPAMRASRIDPVRAIRWE